MVRNEKPTLSHGHQVPNYKLVSKSFYIQLLEHTKENVEGNLEACLKPHLYIENKTRRYDWLLWGEMKILFQT